MASCLVLQLVLGGVLSSHYAGLACTGFPTCDGQSLAPTFEGLVGVHVIHRLNGYVLLIVYMLLAVATWRTGPVGRLAATGLGLVVLQIAVGAANVLLRLPNALTAMHTGIAAAIVLVTALVVREAVGVRAPLAGPVTRARAVEVG